LIRNNVTTLLKKVRYLLNPKRNMDKNKIKALLSSRFVNEDKTPGISVTDSAKKESDKINKAAIKAVAKDVDNYDKG
jgi:hypothetical protein